MRVILAIAAAAIVAASGVVAQAQPRWKEVGSLGSRHIVIVNSADSVNEGLLKQAAEDVCEQGKLCVVAFWSDPAEAPNAMPMTVAQQQAMVAQYMRNPTSGIKELMLKCSADSAPAAGTKCLR